MNNLLYINAWILLIFSALLSSCSVIGGIFETGVGFGIFISAIIATGIIILFIRLGKKQ